MTNWEQWLRGRDRKDIICAMVDHDGTGRCDKNCILYKFCSKNNFIYDEKSNAIDEFLDSEAVMERDAVIINLAAIRKSAEKKGYDGFVRTLDRAIELLKED